MHVETGSQRSPPSHADEEFGTALCPSARTVGAAPLSERRRGTRARSPQSVDTRTFQCSDDLSPVCEQKQEVNCASAYLGSVSKGHVAVGGDQVCRSLRSDTRPVEPDEREEDQTWPG